MLSIYMTDVTKQLITDLMAGCSIYGTQHGFLLRSTANSYMRKINPRTWRQVKRYMRKGKDGLFVIDLRTVRKESGKTWIKQQYKKQLNTNS